MSADANPVLEAIKDDPHLLPEAKEHLLNQYGLLRRIGSVPDRQPLIHRQVAHRTTGEPLELADEQTEAAILADVERAARANPKSPRGRRNK